MSDARRDAMSEAPVEARLRRYLLAAAAAVFGATLVELALVAHTGDAVQLVPFVLCGLGLGLVVVAWVVPGPKVVRGLRAVMVVVALGGLYGVYEHAAHNLAFELEIRPTAAPADVWWDAVTGASPLLAPGTLALGALLALAATYRHPALARRHAA